MTAPAPIQLENSRAPISGAFQAPTWHSTLNCTKSNYHKSRLNTCCCLLVRKHVKSRQSLALYSPIKVTVTTGRYRYKYQPLVISIKFPCITVCVVDASSACRQQRSNHSITVHLKNMAVPMNLLNAEISPPFTRKCRTSFRTNKPIYPK